MSKTSKEIAETLLKQCSTLQGKKEVVNACLHVLKVLSEQTGALSEKEIKNINAADSGMLCGSSDHRGSLC